MNHNKLPTTSNPYGGFETPEAQRDAQKSLDEWNGSVSNEQDAQQERAKNKKGLLKRVGGRAVGKLIQVGERRQAKKDAKSERAFIEANKENPSLADDPRFREFWDQEQLAKTNPFSESWNPDSVPAGQSANLATRQREQQQVADFKHNVSQTGKIDINSMPASMNPDESKFYEDAAAFNERANSARQTQEFLDGHDQFVYGRSVSEAEKRAANADLQARIQASQAPDNMFKR